MPPKDEDPEAALNEGSIATPVLSTEGDIDDESSLPTYNESTVQEFSQMDLSPEILKGIHKLGWTQPTEVQALCLPAALRGENVVGFAQTGTGKTGVFLIALAQKLTHTNLEPSSKLSSPPAVILAPTRELALQIHDECKRFLMPLGIRSALIFGGVDYDKQIKMLKQQPHVIVATPGRLKDFMMQKTITLQKTMFFVCDEVDQMFDIGFLDDVEYFFKMIHKQSQKLMFSATTSDSLQEICFEYIQNPQFLSVAHPDITPESIEQRAILCSTQEKLRVFMGLLKTHAPKRAIIFTNTKITAFWLHHKLSHNGFNTDLITGDLPQNKRIALIRRIKAGDIRYLIATDVASRGLHIADISHVYNFDLPTEPTNYVHRIGRTARAGATGKSYSLVCDEYGSHLLAINELLKMDVPCEWFPKEYLKIEDQASDPFLNQKRPNIKQTTAKKPSRDSKTKTSPPLKRKDKKTSHTSKPQSKHTKPTKYSNSKKHKKHPPTKTSSHKQGKQNHKKALAKPAHTKKPKKSISKKITDTLKRLLG